MIEQTLPDFVLVYLHFNIPPNQANRFDCGNVLDEKIIELTENVHEFHSVENNSNTFKTRGPLGHLLDTAIRCFRAVRVGIIIAEKMAVEKLQFH